MKAFISYAALVLILIDGTSNPAAAAQTLTKVVEFGGPNQAQTGFVEDPTGTLYSWDRGSDSGRLGRIASIQKNGSGVSPLHAFAGTADDGDTPFCLIYGSDGVLYGVTVDVQARTRGRVFSLSPEGSSYHVLRRWDAAVNEHGSPFGLIEGSDHALYGVAQPGGNLGSNTIWKLNKDGSGYAVLHDFEAGFTSPDTTYGPNLTGNLIEARDGKLYGVNDATSNPAGKGQGMVFRLSLDGSGYEVIHEFAGNGLGSGPTGRLLHANDGYLYGIANSGGTGNRSALYRLRPDGTDFSVLVTESVGTFDFSNRLVESSDGFLYGTCSNGGQFAAGTIYRVHPDGSGFETLHEFNLLAQPPLGIQPTAPLHGSDGNLYFAALQQTSFVGVGESRPFLLRFGPVPLPVPASPSLVIDSIVAISGQNRQFTMRFTRTPGHQYDIQATDRIPPAWQSVQKITAGADGKVEYVDVLTNTAPNRFFRVAE